MVTGRRTLCIVGTSPEDTALEIPHSAVASVSVHTGLLAKRLELKTPTRVYHCWVGRSTDTSLLDDTAAYIDELADADPDPVPPGGGAEGGAGPDCDRQLDEDVNFRQSCGEDVSASDFDSAQSGEESSDSDPPDTVTYRGREVDSSYLQ